MRRSLLAALTVIAGLGLIAPAQAIPKCKPPVDTNCRYYPQGMEVHCDIFIAAGGFEFCHNDE